MTSADVFIPCDIFTILAWESICIQIEFIWALLAYNLLTALREPTISLARILQTSLSPLLAASWRDFLTWKRKLYQKLSHCYRTVSFEFVPLFVIKTKKWHNDAAPMCYVMYVLTVT